MAIPATARSFSDITGTSNSLMSDWLLSDAHTNEKLRSNLPKIVRMCRGLEESNGYYRRFLDEWTTNVIGPDGIQFQSQVSFSNGSPDKNKRELLEKKFNEWKDSPTAWASGMTYVEGAQLCERCVARDGMAFVRKITGYPNQWLFSLQLIDYSYLDLEITGTFQGRRVFLGTEVDQYGKPVAYYLKGQHSSDDVIQNIAGRKAVRVPATELLCRFHKERPEQMAGVPLAVGAISGLRHLEKYEEAEVVAARVAACSSIAWEREMPTEYEGEDGNDLVSNMEMTPGGMLTPPHGYKPTLLSPQHPNSNLEQFRKGMLRGAAAAMSIPYARIAADPSDANYSSMREDRLQASDVYRTYQGKVICQQERPIWQSWLEMQITATNNLPFEPSQMTALMPARFQGRGWDWVDPAKETAAAEKSLALRLTSRKRELAKRGIDIDELDREIEADTVVLQSPPETTSATNANEED